VVLSVDTLSFLAVVLLSLASLILLISHDWRLSVSALGALYVGVFGLTAFSWSLEMAVVKLVTGWIAASVLGMGLINLKEINNGKIRYWPSFIIFRLSAAGLILMVAFSLVSRIQIWLPGASFEQCLGGLILVGMGILHLGFTAQSLQTILGLLTFFAGFEILYATFEASVLVAGFLAMINLGLAFIGAYLQVVPTLEVEK
jgi:hypothetical protein